MPLAATVPRAIIDLGGNTTYWNDLFNEVRASATDRRQKASREDDAVIFAATLRYFWMKGRHRRPPRPPQELHTVDDSREPAAKADPPHASDSP